MFEVFTEPQAADEITQMNESACPSIPSIPSAQSAQTSHWTRRLPDPLGAALIKIQKARTTLDEVDAAAQSWQANNSAFNATAVLSDSKKVESAASIETVPWDTAKSSGEDRRAFPRRQSECLVTLLLRCEIQSLTPREVDVLLQNGRMVGRLLDISQTGLCLLWAERIADNTEVVLRIHNQSLNRHVDATAHVIHSKSAGHGRFSIHCRVLREFTIGELQDLGHPLVVNHLLG